MSEQSQPRPESTSVTRSLLDRKRLLLMLVALLLEFGIFFAGLLTPVSVSTQQSLANATTSQFGLARSGSVTQLAEFIFTHNLAIGLAEMVPLLGAFLFVFSVYSTGLAAQAIVAASGYPSQWGAVIFAFPYSLVELSAYAVAVASGSMLLFAWRRKRLRGEIRVFVAEIAAVALVLLVAAFMEAATIRVSWILGLALWLPTGLGLAVIIVATGRSNS